MTPPEKSEYKSFVIYTYSQDIQPSLLIGQMEKGKIISHKGRGGIRVFTINGRKLVCRQYLHGGLFRAFTGDRFFSAQRALGEARMLGYLGEQNFPAVRPCCVIAEKKGLVKRLYLVTEFLDGSSDFSDVWRTASPMGRFRIIRRLARLFLELTRLGVYHPDLHINNILVDEQGGLVFLDFDRASRMVMTVDDVEKMLWRLDRYIEKQQRKGTVSIDIREKIFFLRVYQRLSGYDILSRMEKRVRVKRSMNRIGWFVESLLYGGKK